jgi:hypothetical protein
VARHTETIRIDGIHVGNDRRPLVSSHVDTLAASIKPITAAALMWSDNREYPSISK